MTDSDVRVERLEPMRVASVRAVSEIPEPDAWETMRAWAEPAGLLDDLAAHPVFGFNNPNPSSGRAEYGYEFWIRVDLETQAEGGIEVKDFGGGSFAVTTCKIKGDPQGSVFEVWQKLFEWVKSSEYEWRRTHELEKVVNPQASEGELVLDLYLPIEE